MLKSFLFLGIVINMVGLFRIAFDNSIKFEVAQELVNPGINSTARLILIFQYV